MITNNGTAVQVTLLEVVVHELVHALTGRSDAPATSAPGLGIFDYRGPTVTFTNTIEEELGIPVRNSYPGVAETGTVLTLGFEYTNGAAIDRSVAGDRDWSTWTALVSNDLLVGGPSANILESGLGDDFLFGGRGDDFLNGGLFGTDTVVLTGNPVDYDIRLKPDGTWTSEHVRGTADEGTDTFKNLEKVLFAGSGQTFDLEKSGLTYQRDIAFVVDQTGSMFDDIDAVKATATGVINALFAGNTVDARIGMVGFRDNTIGEITSVILPFTDQDSFADRQAAALNGINSLSASGGGDFPETAFDGLLKALNGTMGEWRVGAGTKQVILFTDASAKDAFLLPTVMSYATDIGAVITGSSSATLGTVGAVDTFELSFADSGASSFHPDSEGDPPPEYVPSGDPIQPPGGTATVQIFTIFIETFISPDPNLVEVSESSGGAVLTAATPEEVVEQLIGIISTPPGNGPPIGTPEGYTADEDSALVVAAATGVLVNDTDPDGDPLSAILVSNAQHGSVTLSADGSFTYTPEANFNGADSFTYKANDGTADSAAVTVGLTVMAVNDDPLAHSDIAGVQIAESKKGKSSITSDADHGVLVNDVDVDAGDHLVVSAVNGSAAGVGKSVVGTYGSLTLNADGSYKYVTESKVCADSDDLVAQDVFAYTTSDGHGGTSTASLTITLFDRDATYWGGTDGDDTHAAGKGETVLDGGRGNDVLTGGRKEDVLIGGEGDDLLTGGKSEDTFVFRPNFGHDRISDFDVRRDTLQFSNGVFASAADLLAHTTDGAGGAMITDSLGDTLTLMGVTKAQLAGYVDDWHLA
ncbi:Ig-like domain-containing protein [Bradyrhizobium sp. USDA 4520]